METERVNSQYFDREDYLVRAVAELKSSGILASYPVPYVWLSVGWPLGSRKAIGQCHHGIVLSEDKHDHIFISPVLQEDRVLDVLIHELGHAALGHDVPAHKKEFRDFMRATGLTGKPTATTAGPELESKLKAIREHLGPYGHKRLDKAEKRKVQSTRMIKLECPDCGYVVRAAKKWIETGLPLCHCGTEFIY